MNDFLGDEANDPANKQIPYLYILCTDSLTFLLFQPTEHTLSSVGRSLAPTYSELAEYNWVESVKGRFNPTLNQQ